MSSWVALRSLLPNVGGGPETAAVPSKDRHGSMLADLLLRLRRRGSTSDEEMDTVELYEMLMHLGLSVCLADPGECAGVVRGFARSEASALRCLSRLIIPALSSCTNICVSGIGGQQMCAVEGILSAFLLSTSDAALAPESTATAPARSSANSGLVAGFHAPNLGPSAPVVGFQSQGSVGEIRTSLSGPSDFSCPDTDLLFFSETLNNAWSSQNTSFQELSTKDSNLPVSPMVKSRGKDRLLLKRMMSGSSGSSVRFLRKLLRNQASERTAVTTGDVSWTGDGCPVGSAVDQAQQSRALSKRYANNHKERCERSVSFDVPISGPTSPRDSRRDGGSPWDAGVPPKSLLMFLVLKAAPAQGMQQLPLGMHARRVTSECSSVSTTDLLDFALGYRPGSIGSLDSLEEMTNEQLSTTSFGRNVEQTALEERRASEGGQNGGDAEQEDPQAKWLARKIRLAVQKQNDEKKAKVTYGVLLRQQQVGDEGANTPSTGSCGGGAVGSSSGAAAGGRRSGWRTPPESTTATESVIYCVSPCSSNGVSFGSNASGCQEHVDGETPHEKWRRRKLERAEAKNVSRILTKQSSASISLLPGFVDQAFHICDDSSSSLQRISSFDFITRSLVTENDAEPDFVLPPQPLAVGEGGRRSWTNDDLHVL
mmetsp:Transcript_149360/g.478529  ORF Transcript_149360/g.478529 Transcript_149360/m.478529 type:complete len:654 (-) Transcript_149360:116-2077(-)